ncbi:hypothetical protein OAI_11445 [Vibrio cyclitrophicus FF160]|uniref:glycosyltransferase family 4 protein n=1 Tax=Vibrio cyclitrophicus TaxID=47951 RepID=UPI000308B6FD|nr:glycosyltransferase family 4 protein [Vibrio cyclitrophicus]OEE81583.1 hypothetical protein OAI_11445 [Vibrio cyclitrophicus FF160]
MITVLVPSLQRKGPVIVAVNIVNELTKKGFEVNLIYLKASNKELEINKNVHVSKLKISNLYSILKSRIIHSHGFLPDIINFLLYFFVFFGDKKHISTIHNFMHADFNVNYSKHKAFLMNMIWPKILKKLDIIFISETQQDFLNKHYIFEGRQKVIYNSVTVPDKLNLKDNVTNWLNKTRSNNHIILGTCCVLTKLKSVETIIESLRYLPSNYSLVIIGDGEQRASLESLTQKYKLTKRVFFTGFITEPHSLINEFDIFVFPTLVEAFGLSGIEASIMGVPVICSDIEIFRELYFSKSTSFFQPSNSQDLAKKIIDFKYITVDTFGYKSKFSPITLSEEFEKFYN